MLTNIHFKDDLKVLLLFVWKQNTTTLHLFYDVIEKRVEKKYLKPKFLAH